MVGVDIGTEECVVERVIGAKRDGGADCVANWLAGTPSKQAAAFIVTESLEQKTSCLERFVDTGTPLVEYRI